MTRAMRALYLWHAWTMGAGCAQSEQAAATGVTGSGAG